MNFVFDTVLRQGLPPDLVTHLVFIREKNSLEPVVKFDEHLKEEWIISNVKKARICLFKGQLFEANERKLGPETVIDPFQLSVPFPKTWVERLDNSDLFEFKMYDSEFKITAGLLEETSLGFFVTLFGARDGKYVTVDFSLREITKIKDAPILGTCLPLFNLFTKNEDLNFGEAKVELKIPTARRLGREIHRVRKIVLVSSEKNIKNPFLPSNPVEWKHSWEVMGHWRKIQGLGKNRIGEFTVSGRTWVKPHVKGEGPLVVKTRVIDSPIGDREL